MTNTSDIFLCGNAFRDGKNSTHLFYTSLNIHPKTHSSKVPLFLALNFQDHYDDVVECFGIFQEGNQLFVVHVVHEGEEFAQPNFIKKTIEDIEKMLKEGLGRRGRVPMHFDKKLQQFLSHYRLEKALRASKPSGPKKM